jgi:putative ABC transport system ATP-binding protein
MPLERRRWKAALQAEALTKSYRSGKTLVQALRGVSLEITEGELVAIMGPSGCGKSTLLHVLGGLLTPTSGSVRVAGVELSTLKDSGRTELRRRHSGFVFQKFNLLPALTVEGNLRLAERISLGYRDPRLGESRRRELLELLGLSSRRQSRPAELSGGEQQRVAIARAIVHQPDILMADEPTGNLDSESSENVLEMLRRVHRELSQTIVLITHDLEVARSAERVVRMKDGRIVS